MNKSLATLVLALAGGTAMATDVGVSVQISQPGVYGRIDIGRFPQPAVVVAQPVVVARPVAVAPPPAYLWVPPGHRKNWRRHCHRYGACGTPVYFVQEGWYRQHVMAGQPLPRYQARHHRGHSHSHSHGHGHGRGRGRDD